MLWVSAAFAEDIVPTAEIAPLSASAINRPDFKVKNLPSEAEGDAVSAGVRDGGIFPEMEGVSHGSQFEPTQESLLSSVPEDLILHYIDQSDFDKGLLAHQRAAKYLGVTVREGSPTTSADSLVIRWLMMSDGEQRAAKLSWFQTIKSSISLDEFNRYVDLRAFRVLTTLRGAQTPGLRLVEPPKSLTAVEIEKLQLPGIRPIREDDEPARHSLESIPRVGVPTLKPISRQPSTAPDRPSDAAYPPEEEPRAGELFMPPPPPLKSYGGRSAGEPSTEEPVYQPMFKSEEPVIQEQSPALPEEKSSESPGDVPVSTERLPSYLGIPSGLRNAP